MKRPDAFTISMFIIILVILSVFSLDVVYMLAHTSKLINMRFGFTTVGLCSIMLLVMYLRAAGVE